jgi:hypothetical protein
MTYLVPMHGVFVDPSGIDQDLRSLGE